MTKNVVNYVYSQLKFIKHRFIPFVITKGM